MIRARQEEEEQTKREPNTIHSAERNPEEKSGLGFFSLAAVLFAFFCRLDVMLLRR